MSRLADIRLHAQQLAAPQCDDPVDAVRRMGAVQAQEYASAKWAVGLRLRRPSLRAVDEALAAGRLLRMHILRPTWHLIAAEDVRWMLRLTGRRIRAANASFARSCGYGDIDYARCERLLVRLLEGGRQLTRPEIAAGLGRAGESEDPHRVKRILMCAESEGLICSGADRGAAVTYALLAERVPQPLDLSYEEALALLARRYFGSRSPATFEDFVWWSGLTVAEARRGVASLGGELSRETFDGREYLLHESCAAHGRTCRRVHLLPAFDEYLIAYRDRSAVLADEYRSRAFNAYGTFRPVMLCSGRVAGCWTRGGRGIETEPFAGERQPAAVQLRAAIARWERFHRTTAKS